MTERGKARRFALLDLVTTGRLGPLQTGMTMGFAASVLGPPRYWNANLDNPDAIPSFWGYSHLEFSFIPDGKGKTICNWFQFDNVMLAGKRVSKEAEGFSIWLGDFGSKSRPSDFLRSLQGRNDVVVQLCDEAGQAGVTIKVSDTVKVIFNEEETGFDAFMQLGFAERIGIIERKGYCHCITSSLPDKEIEAHDFNKHGKEWITPVDFLRIADASSQ
mgnify:CR=1 FL=1